MGREPTPICLAMPPLIQTDHVDDGKPSLLGICVPSGCPSRPGYDIPLSPNVCLQAGGDSFPPARLRGLRRGQRRRARSCAGTRWGRALPSWSGTAPRLLLPRSHSTASKGYRRVQALPNEHTLFSCAANGGLRRAGLVLRWHFTLPGTEVVGSGWGVSCRCRASLSKKGPAGEYVAHVPCDEDTRRQLQSGVLTALGSGEEAVGRSILFPSMSPFRRFPLDLEWIKYSHRSVICVLWGRTVGIQHVTQ